MKIMVYCQHVLGIGHLCRTLLILQQLEGHRITLVLGGPPVSLPLPDYITVVQLPGLQMDDEFSGLLPVEPGQELERIKEKRTNLLLNLFNDLQPDLLLVELFPFGRNGFRFELLPLLAEVKKQNKCRVACSVRDILVERDNTEKFEQRVIDRLNDFFHLLLIHGDPKLIRLDQTFSRMDEINIPLAYTGYICQQPHSMDRKRLRSALQLDDCDQLIVVSAGSGSVGKALLRATLQAFTLLDFAGTCTMQVFTGPYLSEADFKELTETSHPAIKVERFTDNFPAWLAAADISVSMAGYNTTMNLVAAGCPALVYPFSQNHEQKMRAERLAKKGLLQLLSDTELDQPSLLAEIIQKEMLQGLACKTDVMLDGAVRSAELLTSLAGKRGNNDI